MYPNQPEVLPETQPDPIATGPIVGTDGMQQSTATPSAMPQFAQPVSEPVAPVVSAAPVAPSMPAFMQPDPVMAQTAPESPLGMAAPGENPDKSYLVAVALSYFMGTMGVDRIYLGRTVTGVAKLVTLGGFGIWYLVDLLRLTFGSLRASGDPRPLSGFAKEGSWTKLATIVLIIFNVVVFGGFILLFIISGAMTVNSF